MKRIKILSAIAAAVFTASVLVGSQLPKASIPAEAQTPTTTHFQVGFSWLVPAMTQHVVTNSQYAHISAPMPYTVPAGKELRIVDITFGSKHVVYSDERSSYLVISNVMTVTEHGPTVHFNQPWRLPEGAQLRAEFFNNSPEDQWMVGTITGRLVTCPCQ